MSAPKTYHRNKIENFYHRLVIRKAVLKNQLEQPEFKALTEMIQGEIKAVDTILAEMREEFAIDEKPVPQAQD